MVCTVDFETNFFMLLRLRLNCLILQQMIANQDSVIEEGEYEEVEEGVHASSRYSSFLNKRKARAWGIDETKLFYKVNQTE